MNTILRRIQTFFTPPKLYSWQTAIFLCLFAWILALVTTHPFRFLLTELGWIFLIIAVGWMTTENPIKAWGLSLSPWLTGLLVCIFLFVTDWRSGLPRIAFIFWPLTSTLIALVPSMFKVESGFRLPPLSDRPRLLVIFLSNLLLLCWILFNFQIQDWLDRYPQLRQESFRNSGFVIAIGQPTLGESRGTQVTNLMADEVILHANGQTRTAVERWLFNLQKDPKAPEKFRSKVMDRLVQRYPLSKNDVNFWQLEIVIAEPEYQLVLGARWMGPSSNKESSLVEQACQIRFRGPKPTDLATVQCAEARRTPSKQNQRKLDQPTQNPSNSPRPNQAKG
jgi:hypothetical protein